MTDGNIEQQTFALLWERQVSTLCEVCQAAPYHCPSIRQALYRLRAKGRAETVLAGGVRVFFVVREAMFPADDRGKR